MRYSPRFSRSMLFGLLSATMVLSGCAAEFAYVPRESTIRFAEVAQAKTFRNRYSDLPLCTRFQQAYFEAGWPRGDTIDVVREIDERVRERFVYRREKTDSWNAYVKTMLETEHRWAGDCDDLSATVVSLARCAGVPDDRLGFFLVKADGSDKVNHMIGFYTDPHGRSYAVGDTFGRVRPMLTYRQEPYAWTFLDDMSKWHKVDEGTNFQNPAKAVIEVRRARPKQ